MSQITDEEAEAIRTAINEVKDRRERMARAAQVARDLRWRATSVDGWCSLCHQIDKHLDWCPWTRLLELLEERS